MIRHFGRGFGRSDDRFGLVMGACGRRQDEGAVGDRRFKAVVDDRAVENTVSAGRHHHRFVVRPALPRLDQTQPFQTEIRHGARGSADIFAKLRFDQHDDGRRPCAPSLGLVGAGARHARSSAGK